jgi:nucleoside-diphosphate-sugar epimerase
MTKVLVTGATGFIGNYVIRALLAKGLNVVATSSSQARASGEEWFNKVTYIPLDLKNVSGVVDYYLFFQKPDKLIHLAWEGLPNYKALFHVEENLPRHYTFLQNIISNGLKDITVAGTCFEYGLQEGCLSEDMPAIPVSPYAHAKNKLRLSLQELAVQTPFQLKWLRLFYMYGKGQNPNSLFSQLETAVNRGDQVFNMSPGDQLRDFLPIEKMAEYIVDISLQEMGAGIINCCSGKPVSVKEMVTNFLGSRQAELKLNLGYYPYSDIEPQNFWGNDTKLKTILTDEKSHS